MPGVSQSEFIRPVAEALHAASGGSAGRLSPVEPPADREAARVVRPSDDFLERFCAMVVDAKMKLHRIAGEAPLVTTILQILKDIGAKQVLLTDEPLPRREELIAALRNGGYVLADLRQNDCAFEADVGITLARLGIAETGSIAIRSGPDTRRLASLAAPEHIAILRREHVVPDLLDWAATLAEPMPANEVLITGPSKTADIEMNLVMGVHGPKNVHVILLQ